MPFIPITDSSDTKAGTDTDELFYCRDLGADGRGIYTEEGFVVLQGSSGPANLTGVRETLLESGVYEQEGNRYVFQRDHLFKSPSRAARALLNKASNGWIDWKNDAGETLDQVRRVDGSIIEQVDTDELFYCTRAGVDGRGRLTTNGFVVLKGSSSQVGSNTIRDALIESGVYKQEGNRYVFQRDHLFKSPSRAAMVLLVRSSNGWTAWKNASGQTLDEVKRKNLETVE